MTRKEVRDFIRNGVNSISPVLDFFEGQITDWNSERSNQYPGVMHILETTDTDIPTSNTPPVDKWNIKLIIANKDALDSNPEDYENIVDQCDNIAQKLIYKYRAIISGYKLLTIEGINRKRFVKKYADCITGIELTFALHNQDQTNVC